MAKTPPPHQYLPPAGRARGQCPTPSHHVIVAARSGGGSERGGRIKPRASSLPGRRLAGVPLAGDGGSNRASPALLRAARRLLFPEKQKGRPCG